MNFRSSSAFSTNSFLTLSAGNSGIIHTGHRFGKEGQRISRSAGLPSDEGRCCPDCVPVPTRNGLVPSDWGQGFCEWGHVPSQKGPVPSEWGRVPNEKGPVPGQWGHVPNGRNNVPSHWGHVPSGRSSVPSHWGHVPNGKNKVPSRWGHVPNEGKAVPSPENYPFSP